MTDAATNTGKELELEVADAYRRLGAHKVEHDVEMAGNQIDVYFELTVVGRQSHLFTIGAENPLSPMGTKVAGKFLDISDCFHCERLDDQDVIVLAAGLREPTWTAARKHDHRMPKPPYLDSMVTGAHVRGKNQVPVSPGNTFLLSRSSHLQFNSPQAASRLSVQPTENPPQVLRNEHTE